MEPDADPVRHTNLAVQAHVGPLTRAAKGIWQFKATLLYVLMIPFVNWSFTWAPIWTIAEGWDFTPIFVVTGLVLVVRDFVQREIGHRVFYAMAVALVLTTLLAGPELAVASGLAFAISEIIDWALFTFSKLRLSTRVLISSLAAAPVDTVVFLVIAEMIREGLFTIPNVVLSITGKLIGAVVVSGFIRRREQQRYAPKP